MANAPFQKMINRTLPPGQGGDLYSNAPNVITAYLAVDDITPGNAVFNPAFGTTNVAQPKQCAATSTDGTDFCGFATRMTTGNISDLYDAYSNVINAGLNVQVLSQGEIKLKLADGTGLEVGAVVKYDPATGIPTCDPTATGTTGNTVFSVVEILDAATFIVAVSTWRNC